MNASQTSMAARKQQQFTGAVAQPNARVFRCTAGSRLTERATGAPRTVDDNKCAAGEAAREAVSGHVIETRTAACKQLTSISGHGQGR